MFQTDDDNLRIAALAVADGVARYSRRAMYANSHHAPKGGIEIGGTRYPGGEFIPGDVAGKFSETPGEYWRIHPKEFTEAELHDGHKSRVWLDQDDVNTRAGLSVAKSIEDLVSYFAGHKKGGSSPGRGATFAGTHLVRVEGDESIENPYEEDDGERLIHPKRLIDSTPIESTPFLELLREKINETWGGD